VEGCRDWIAGACWESEGERVHALIRRHPMRDILGQALEEAFTPTS
jgi:hypothetical protein